MDAPETEPASKVDRLAKDIRFRAEVVGGASRMSLLRRFGGEYGCAEATIQRARNRVLEEQQARGLPTSETAWKSETGPAQPWREPQRVETERTLFFNDVHCPFHDRRSVQTMLEFCRFLQPAYIYAVGDIVDFYALSRYDKDPKRATKLQDELDTLHSFWDDLRSAAPHAKIYAVEGNHEARLTRYLWKHPELSEMRNLQPAEILGLKERDITWISDRESHLHNGILVTHGSYVRKWAGHSAKAEYDAAGVSGISGHTHRAAIYRYRDLSGDYIWVENGCLAGLNPEYCRNPNWAQCVTVGSWVKDDSRFQLDVVQIVNHKLLYQGMLFG